MLRGCVKAVNRLCLSCVNSWSCELRERFYTKSLFKISGFITYLTTAATQGWFKNLTVGLRLGETCLCTSSTAPIITTSLISYNYNFYIKGGLL